MLPRFALPLDARDFLRDYWQKQPLWMPASASGLELPDPDTLASLSLDEAVESRLMLGAGKGPWQVRQGPFEETTFSQLPEQNWTLLLQSVDHYLTDVSLLLDSFRFLPGWRLEDIMISYASRGGSVGAHFDRYDVFLLQARGQRRWAIGPHCDESTPLLPHESLRLLDEMPEEEVHVAGPGDVLYLPPGVGHHGVALDDDCVTWSVGFRAPRLKDLLAALTDEALEQDIDPLFCDPGRSPPLMPGQLDDPDLKALKAAALGLIGSDTSEAALARLCSTPRQQALDFAVDCRHIRAAAPEATLVRHGACRMLCSSSGAWINGEHWPLNHDQRQLAEYLSGQRLYTADLLDQLINQNNRELFGEWIERGYFEPLP